MPKTSRRAFLKTSAVAGSLVAAPRLARSAGGAAPGAAWPPDAQAPTTRAHPAPSTRATIALDLMACMISPQLTNEG